VSGSGISWVICKSAPRSRQLTTPTPHHSVFYRPDALPAAQPTASKHRRHKALKAQPKSSLTNFQEISRMHFSKKFQKIFTWQAIQYKNAGEVCHVYKWACDANPWDHSNPVYPSTTLWTVYKNRPMCKNCTAKYKIFQQHQLNATTSWGRKKKKNFLLSASFLVLD